MVITFSLPEKQGALSLQDALAALLHSEVRIRHLLCYMVSLQAKPNTVITNCGCCNPFPARFSILSVFVDDDTCNPKNGLGKRKV